MQKDAIEEIRNRKKRMAICYDFDKTLSPDDMQAFTLIPSLEMDKSEFWSKSNELARENLMDNNLAWMFQLITFSKAKRKSIKREYFNEVGKSVKLYKGVEDWFDRVNKYAELLINLNGYMHLHTYILLMELLNGQHRQLTTRIRRNIFLESQRGFLMNMMNG